MFALGAWLAMTFLYSSEDGRVVAAVALACTLTWIGSALRMATTQLPRWVGRACTLAVVGCHIFWAYLAVAFGLLLGWTISGQVVLLVILASAAAVGTLHRRRDQLHVPLVLPLGIWIAASLSGWQREENLLRCDDYLALRPPVQLVVPSDPRHATCRPEEVRPSGRFPRTIWEAPDGKRLVFTTSGRAEPGGLDGGVCEAVLGSGVAPRCVGSVHNKSQGLTEWRERDRLLAFQWGITTPWGTQGAVVYEFPLAGPLSILSEHWFDESVAEGFYEPRNSTLYMFSDAMNGIHRVSLPDFKPQPKIPIEGLTPGELRYDVGLGEGVLCASKIGVAVRGEPFSVRQFAEDGGSPIDAVGVSWGCDWDPKTRKVYSTIPNLGLLERIDYDSGQVEKRWFVGPGMRSVAYDPVRQRIYFTDFLRGYVLAFDEQSERIVDRWFVGRFSRWVRLTRDGHALLATGNLGIVSIPLDK